MEDFVCHQNLNLTFFNTGIYMYVEIFMSLNFIAFSLYHFNFSVDGEFQATSLFYVRIDLVPPFFFSLQISHFEF